jgi:tRNA (uracil-5-)-methyltransferase
MPLPVVDPSRYEQQLQQKAAELAALFAEFDAGAPQLHRSAPEHYRLRAEFRLWHDKGQVDYVMFDPEAPQVPVRLTHFPAGSTAINALMAPLRERLNGSDTLKRKLFQLEFLTTLSGEVLVTLIYHRKLDDEWEQAARELATQLDIMIIGRSRGQKLVLQRDYVNEVLSVGSRRLRYRQIEGSFTQPNGGVNQQMLEWACDAASDLSGDLLELYCGNGNFTVALAPQFRRVLATEISKSSVQVAVHNLAANGIDNVALVRMSSEELTRALHGEREFFRLRNLDLDDYQFSTLFVDPPRSGLDDGTLHLAARFDNILYISCNPQTLHANLRTLNETHRAVRFALFDQFPYTHHTECGVLLQRR